MEWIVLGERGGMTQLVSKKENPGILPKGSYLTVGNENKKFILRVDDSKQDEPYSPSPMIVDMDLAPLRQDQKCQNIIHAYRVKDTVERTDGLIDYIPPQSKARRSNQEEIDLAMGSTSEGPRVFLATVHSSQNQILIDSESRFIISRIPDDVFFHQILICGKTGSGKTVASKYMAQYFVEDLEGAVLAINVKDVDFLRMDKPSQAKNPSVLKEWEALGEKARGIDNFIVYYPANTSIHSSLGVTPDICRPITLNVQDLEPESFTGLLQGITDAAAQNLPNIFRYWQDTRRREEDVENFTFSDFVSYFARAVDDNRRFITLNSKGDTSEIVLHSGTFNSIQRHLNHALDFFDNEDAMFLTESDILSRGKMSVINVAGKKGIQFGSILLRHLLHKIVSAKAEQRSTVPILIIIDEVHQFYDTGSSKEALGELDTICRTGRSQKIGVVFSSQNPSDIPRGLDKVINTKIFFKSDASAARALGIKVSGEEMETLKKGFACATIHDLSQLRLLKFPLSYAGVFE